MKRVDFRPFLPEVDRVLPGGVFLTTKNDKEINTMTMGWGTIGYIWNKAVFMVPVRKSRHTHSIMENSDTFTVSVPLKGQLKEELRFCGTESGEDYNKIEHLGLSTKFIPEVDVPVISGCELHFACNIIYQQSMQLDNLKKDIKTESYPEEDPHTFYYGEIITAYREQE